MFSLFRRKRNSDTRHNIVTNPPAKQTLVPSDKQLSFEFDTTSLTLNTELRQEDKSRLELLLRFWSIRLSIHIDKTLKEGRGALLFRNDTEKFKASLYELCFFDYHKVIEVLESKQLLSPTINSAILESIKVTFENKGLKYNSNWYHDYKKLEEDKIEYYKDLHQYEDRIQNLERMEVEKLYFKIVDQPCTPLLVPPFDWDIRNQEWKLEFISTQLSHQDRLLQFLKDSVD